MTAASPSLALTGDLSHSTDDPEHEKACPRKVGWVMYSLSSGATFPARCGANFCEFCAPINASVIARAMALAEPQRMIRFSLVPSEWAKTQRAMASVMKWMRRNYGASEWAFHVEPNPKGTGNHLHGWQHGPQKIPQSALQDACQRSGLGFPDIRRWRQRGSKAGYGLKGIGYGMKSDDLETFLDLNGGRLVHHSRGFFRDGAGGQRLTLGAAKQRVKVDREERDPGPWVLRHKDELIR